MDLENREREREREKKWIMVCDCETYRWGLTGGEQQLRCCSSWEARERVLTPEFGYVKSENNHLYACSPKVKRRRFTFLFLFFFLFVKPCETRRFINSYSHRDLPFVQDLEYWRISIFRFGTVSIIRVCGQLFGANKRK